MNYDEKIKAIEEVMMKYCNPKKEFDHIPPKQVAGEILTALGISNDSSTTNA